MWSAEPIGDVHFTAVNGYTEWQVGKSPYIYSDNKLYIVAMLCPRICEKNISLLRGTYNGS